MKIFSTALAIAVLCASFATAQTDYIGEGNTLLNERRYELAVESYTKAIQQQPKSTAAYYNRALAYTMMKRADLALADLEIVLQLDPKNTDALVQRSYLYGEKDQFPEALRDLNAALALDSTNAFIYFNRAQTYARQKRLEEAISDYSRSIMLKPDVQSYIGRATARLSTKEARLALSDVERALQIDSMNALAWLSRGEAYMAMDVADSALWSWKRSLVLDPRSTYVKYIQEQMGTMSADELGLRDSLFMDAARSIAIVLPRSWHAASSDDGNTVTLRVARQPITAATDSYAEGITIRYYRKASQFVSDKNPTPQMLLSSWSASNLAASKSLHAYNVVRLEPLTITGWTGELREIAMQPMNDGYRIHQYEALLARTDELVTIVAEVAEPLWSVYNSRFLNAIRTINLPVKGY